jgi:redox-sensing transcriptional repressor
MSSPRKVSESTVRRLSSYLRILKELQSEGTRTVSSERLAELGGLTSAQVRKDLSFFGNFGVRGRGYDVVDLGSALTRILGLDRPWKAVVVGAGRLGSALTSYPEFGNQGFHIVAIFDVDLAKLGKRVGNCEIRSVDELRAYAAQESILVGIIATPKSAAQDAADLLVAGGVRGILNFAPAALDVPPGVTVRNVNLAIELEGLSFAITAADNVEAAVETGDLD